MGGKDKKEANIETPDSGFEIKVAKGEGVCPHYGMLRMSKQFIKCRDCTDTRMSSRESKNEASEGNDAYNLVDAAYSDASLAAPYDFVDMSIGRAFSQLPTGVNNFSNMPLPGGNISSDGVHTSHFWYSIPLVLLFTGSLLSRIWDMIQVITGKKRSTELEKEEVPKERFHNVGKLCISDKQIGKGSNGTTVLEGKLIEDGHTVAIKRLLRSHFDVMPREVETLRAADSHASIVRYFFMEGDEDFLYLALEMCMCSLHDLIISFHDYEDRIFEGAEKQPLLKANGYPSAFLIKLMKDIVDGVAYLHKLGILHRDLKPKNVLVQNKVICAKLSDMGISKRLPEDMACISVSSGYGTPGWQAPEQIQHRHQTSAVDMFNLGMLLFFCMTGGRHPFGEKRYEQDAKIVNNQRDLSLIQHHPEAVDLVTLLLNPTPELRPTAEQVLGHLFFWNSEKRMWFLHDASDRFHAANLTVNSQAANYQQEDFLLQELQKTASTVYGNAKWTTKVHAVIVKKGKNKYNGNMVHGLLRLIRNVMNHIGEWPKRVHTIIGIADDEIDSYFATRFPALLIEVYKVLKSHCLLEEKFAKYFN